MESMADFSAVVSAEADHIHGTDFKNQRKNEPGLPSWGARSAHHAPAELRGAEHTQLSPELLLSAVPAPAWLHFWYPGFPLTCPLVTAELHNREQSNHKYLWEWGWLDGTSSARPHKRHSLCNLNRHTGASLWSFALEVDTSTEVFADVRVMPHARGRTRAGRYIHIWRTWQNYYGDRQVTCPTFLLCTKGWRSHHCKAALVKKGRSCLDQTCDVRW